VATALIAPKSALQRFYLPQLDGLRFFAFLAVFAEHAVVIGLGKNGGWLARVGSYGVDLFFVLSAFLITELLLKERERYGTLNVQAFLARRILRIWPLYFGVLALAFIFRKPLELSSSELAIFAVFLGNYAQVIVPAALSTPVINALWTVSIEEQFYLSWPWLLRKFTRRDIVWFAICLLLGGALSRAIVFTSVSGVQRGLLIIQGTPCRIDAIAVGLAISASGFRLRRAWLALPSVGAVIAGGWWMWVVDSPLSTVIAPLIVGIACGGLLLSGMNIPWLGWRPLRYLGRISYGLYVFHGPCLLMARKIGIAVVPIGLLLTIAVAAASYRWFEAPFLSLKQRFEVMPSRPI
jgi:peptidoglycan/LPS O-acetylase OafA/YrhL